MHLYLQLQTYNTLDNQLSSSGLSVYLFIYLLFYLLSHFVVHEYFQGAVTFNMFHFGLLNTN